MAVVAPLLSAGFAALLGAALFWPQREQARPQEPAEPQSEPAVPWWRSPA